MGRKNKKTIQIEESNHTDTISITETSTENENTILSKHIFQHCRTQCYIKMTNFVWSIANFWNACNFMDTLTSSNIKEESYKIDMCINRENNKLHFFICSTVVNLKEQINIHRYKVYIQSTEGAVLCADWKRFYFNTDPLYEVCLQTLQLNETKYLPNNTLSVHFTFESYENIVHTTMYENITEAQELTAATKNFASDEPDSFITFVVDGKNLRVNKSLLCAASSVFNEMLKKSNNDAEREAQEKIKLISNVTYEILYIIILYIKSRGAFELNFHTNDVTSKIDLLLRVLATAHKFDINGLKVKCEKRLIEFITKENVITYLDIAISNNALYLANYVKRFIKLHLDDIRYTTQFLEKMKINPEVISDICELELNNENALYVKYHGD